MSWAIVGKVATVVAPALISGIMGKKGGGGGGGVSSDTQGGSQTIDFNPVGYETSRISPFEYMQLQKDFDQEQAENMKYGGPLYLDMGGGIGDLFETDLFETPVFDPNAPGKEVVVVGGETNTQASASPTEPISSEGMNNEMLAQLEQIMQINKRNDALMAGGDEVLKAYVKRRNKKSPVKGQGNIVPGSGGGRANRQQRQKTASQGITPFQYRAMQGGGALNRQMFAQNFMPNGGDIRGPGGPKDDLIPVMASNGEYMLSKAAVDQAGGGNHARGIANLEQFNNRGNRRYG